MIHSVLNILSLWAIRTGHVENYRPAALKGAWAIDLIQKPEAYA